MVQSTGSFPIYYKLKLRHSCYSHREFAQYHSSSQDVRSISALQLIVLKDRLVCSPNTYELRYIT